MFYMGIENGIGIVGMLTLEEKVGILVLKRQRSGHAFKVLQEKDKMTYFSVLPNSLSQKVVYKRQWETFSLFFLFFFFNFFFMELPTIFLFWFFTSLACLPQPKTWLLRWKMMPKTSLLCKKIINNIFPRLCLFRLFFVFVFLTKYKFCWFFFKK